MNYSDFSWYHGSVPWLKERTIFLTKHGSHAYGTNVPESDVDLKGICIPPKEYYLGNLNRFEQADKQGAVDYVIYGINKFVALASDCNPNIIETLFTDESDWIIPEIHSYEGTWRDDLNGKRTPWSKLVDNRNLFISQKAKHTFSGYAVSQLKRIRTHRGWLLNPMKAQPQRSDFGIDTQQKIDKITIGMVEARFKKIGDTMGGLGYTKDQVETNEAGIVEAVLEEGNVNKALVPIILKERAYNNAMQQWDGYQRWASERNPKRRELEVKYGYDTKHAMHLVRLLTMAEEILGTGKVIVKRPDADFLNSVRRGAIPFEDLAEWAVWKEASLHLIQPVIPYEPDRVAIDNLLMDVVEDMNFR